MRKKIVRFNTLLIAALLIQFLSGCIPVPIYHDAPAETDDIEIPKHQFTRIVVAPYFNRAEVNEFIEALSEADNSIEVIKSDTVFHHAFPHHDQPIEVPVSEILEPDVISRIKAIGVRFIVVLSPYQTSSTDGDGTFIGVYAHGSSEISTSLMGGLIDLEKPESYKYHKTVASGEDSATWILPYLGLFVFGNVPKTEEGAMDGIAQEIIMEIRQETIEQSWKIMVIAGNWESAKLSYSKEQTMKELRKRALHGDMDAQWELYSELPSENNVVWLCQAADQGHVSARNELGKLYFYGSAEYRDFEKLHIQANLSRSCMWFHLAGQADILASDEIEDSGLNVAIYESAEVERTSKVMNALELAEAEKLITAWEPGQCDRDFHKYLGANYDNDPALEKICTAADLGDYTSREELGRIYFIGSRGVKPDLIRAYMWYRLAADVYVSPSMGSGSMQSICNNMTAEQRSAAEQLLTNYRSGQCEQEMSVPGAP